MYDMIGILLKKNVALYVYSLISTGRSQKLPVIDRSMEAEGV